MRKIKLALFILGAFASARANACAIVTTPGPDYTDAFTNQWFTVGEAVTFDSSSCSPGFFLQQWFWYAEGQKVSLGTNTNVINVVAGQGNFNYRGPAYFQSQYFYSNSPEQMTFLNIGIGVKPDDPTIQLGACTCDASNNCTVPVTAGPADKDLIASSNMEYFFSVNGNSIGADYGNSPADNTFTYNLPASVGSNTFSVYRWKIYNYSSTDYGAAWPNTNTAQATVNCIPALSVSIAASPPSGIVGAAENLTAQVTGGSGTYSYTWSMTQAPSGNTAALANSTSASTSFVPNVAGQYQVSLSVTDSAGNMGTAEASVGVGGNGTFTLSLNQVVDNYKNGSDSAFDLISGRTTVLRAMSDGSENGKITITAAVNGQSFSQTNFSLNEKNEVIATLKNPAISFASGQRTALVSIPVTVEYTDSSGVAQKYTQTLSTQWWDASPFGLAFVALSFDPTQCQNCTVGAVSNLASHASNTWTALSDVVPIPDKSNYSVASGSITSTSSTTIFDDMASALIAGINDYSSKNSSCPAKVEIVASKDYLLRFKNTGISIGYTDVYAPAVAVVEENAWVTAGHEFTHSGFGIANIISSEDSYMPKSISGFRVRDNSYFSQWDPIFEDLNANYNEDTARNFLDGKIDGFWSTPTTLNQYFTTMQTPQTVSTSSSKTMYIPITGPGTSGSKQFLSNYAINLPIDCKLIDDGNSSNVGSYAILDSSGNTLYSGNINSANVVFGLIGQSSGQPPGYTVLDVPFDARSQSIQLQGLSRSAPATFSLPVLQLSGAIRSLPSAAFLGSQDQGLATIQASLDSINAALSSGQYSAAMQQLQTLQSTILPENINSTFAPAAPDQISSADLTQVIQDVGVTLSVGSGQNIQNPLLALNESHESVGNKLASSLRINATPGPIDSSFEYSVEAALDGQPIGHQEIDKNLWLARSSISKAGAHAWTVAIYLQNKKSITSIKEAEASLKRKEVSLQDLYLRESDPKAKAEIMDKISEAQLEINALKTRWKLERHMLGNIAVVNFTL